MTSLLTLKVGDTVAYSYRYLKSLKRGAIKSHGKHRGIVISIDDGIATIVWADANEPRSLPVDILALTWRPDFLKPANQRN